MLSPDKMKSEIKLPGMNTQALEQLGKIFEENVQEVAEGYFSLNPKTKEKRIDVALCGGKFWRAHVH